MGGGLMNNEGESNAIGCFLLFVVAVIALAAMAAAGGAVMVGGL